MLLAAGFGLYLGVELLGVQLYPALLDRFVVEPNEAQKEAPYIAHNIEATRGRPTASTGSSNGSSPPNRS